MAKRLGMKEFVLGSLMIVGGWSLAGVLIGSLGVPDGSAKIHQYLYFLLGTGGSLLLAAWGMFSFSRSLRDREDAESKFRSLLDSTPDPLLVLDAKERIVLANRQAELLFGYDNAGLIGKPAESLVRRQVREDTGEQCPLRPESSSTEPQGERPPALGQHQDGSEFPVELSFGPMETKAGSHLICVIRDLSERMAREARRSARHAIRHLLAHSASLDTAAGKILQAIGKHLCWDIGAFWLVDGQAKVLRCLATWRSEVVPTSAFQAATQETTFALGQGLPGRAWQTGKPAWIPDVCQDAQFLRLIPALQGHLHGALVVPLVVGGEVLGVFEFFSHALREPDENQLETLGIIGGQIADFMNQKRIEDTLRKTEEQFRQAQKIEAIGRLAGGVAHDFNNLLTVILGYSDHLLNVFNNGDPLRECVFQISKAAERATALTRQLLVFSRKQVLAPRVLDLNTVVIDMHKMLERLIGEDIHLRTSLAKVLPPVKVDPGQIEQVIMNLAVNARDAMPTGGALIIETAYKELDSAYTRSYPELQPGKYASLAVTDTGCGMDEVVKARLFEPFFTTKEVGKGTGLGLATVYGIVKQSGGHITVYSEPGHGTTFKIYLPLVTEGVCDPSVSPQLLNLPPGNETVLLVEDEEGVRTVTREVLSKLGYKVLEAQHGQEALSLCEKQSEPIHLMVTDMVMPGMNGRQLASEVRRLYPDLKVLFLSGYSDGALVRNGMLDTSRDFLQKPFTPSDLSSKVREVLSV